MNAGVHTASCSNSFDPHPHKRPSAASAIECSRPQAIDTKSTLLVGGLEIGLYLWVMQSNIPSPNQAGSHRMQVDMA
jgi:hypothetical protein